MKSSSIFALVLFLASILGVMSLAAHATSVSPQDSISFTVTTTTNYPMTTGGTLHVTFDSVQLTFAPPQAYSFGVVAGTTQGNWITNLIWQFGDGSVLNVPYCCQRQISEVRYHAYAQPGTYTVVVIAFDNAGNFGNANVMVNWTGSGDPATPVPEYPVGLLPLMASLVLAFFGIASIKKRLRH